MTYTQSTDELITAAENLSKHLNEITEELKRRAADEHGGVTWPTSDLVHGTVDLENGMQVTGLWWLDGDGDYNLRTSEDTWRYAVEFDGDRFRTATPMTAVPMAEWRAFERSYRNFSTVYEFAEAGIRVINALDDLEAQK